MSKHEADPRFEVGDDRPSFLDEIVAGAEKATGKPRIGAMNHGGVHSAEEKLGVSAVPSFVTDFVELPTHRDELGEVAVIVGVTNGKEPRCFG